MAAGSFRAKAKLNMAAERPASVKPENPPEALDI
jgi:hypothetical protein